MSTPPFEANDTAMSSPLPLCSDEIHHVHPGSERSPRVLSSSLPYPDHTSLHISPDPKKKSHARKQPAGHIPRPRNAFILFRCDFVRQKKIPDHVEVNHRNISRIVGTVWKNMSTSQKAPWIAMAETEKKNHAKAHPGYKYHPGYETRGRDVRSKKMLVSSADNSSSERSTTRWTPSPSFTPPVAPLRRSSSCPPPGALPVLSPSFGPYQTDVDMLGHPTPSMTRDDLARRPSRTIMYQSSAPLNLFSPSTDPAPSPLSSGNTPGTSQWWGTDPGSGAPLMSGPYSIAPPRDAPGWDAAPARPDTWFQWSDQVSGSPMGGLRPEPYNLNTSLMPCVFPDWSENNTRPIFTNPFARSPDPTGWSVSSLGGISRLAEPMSVQAPNFSLPVDPLSSHDQLDLALHPSEVFRDWDALNSMFTTRMSLVDTNDDGQSAENDMPLTPGKPSGLRSTKTYAVQRQRKGKSREISSAPSATPQPSESLGANPKYMALMAAKSPYNQAAATGKRGT